MPEALREVTCWEGGAAPRAGALPPGYLGTKNEGKARASVRGGAVAGRGVRR
jgi:hypothetical protein